MIESRMFECSGAAAGFGLRTLCSSARLAVSMRPILSMPLHAFAVSPHVWHELPGYVKPAAQARSASQAFYCNVADAGDGDGDASSRTNVSCVRRRDTER